MPLTLLEFKVAKLCQIFSFLMSNCLKISLWRYVLYEAA